MDCSTPGLPVHHQLPEFAQTYVHQVSDAIQPSQSVIPYSFCLQSFPAWGSITMIQFFTTIQFSSVAQSCPTLCDARTAACQASLSITDSRSLPKLMSIESMMPSNHLILCLPLFLLRSIFPASGSFQTGLLFTSGGQIIGVSAWSSVLQMNTQDWPPLGWTGWISLQSKGLSRIFSNTTVQKHYFKSNKLPNNLLLHVILKEYVESSPVKFLFSLQAPWVFFKSKSCGFRPVNPPGSAGVLLISSFWQGKSPKEPEFKVITLARWRWISQTQRI